MLQIHLGDDARQLDEKRLRQLSDRLEGFSGADIRVLVPHSTHLSHIRIDQNNLLSLNCSFFF